MRCWNIFTSVSLEELPRGAISTSRSLCTASNVEHITLRSHSRPRRIGCRHQLGGQVRQEMGRAIVVSAPATGASGWVGWMDSRSDQAVGAKKKARFTCTRSEHISYPEDEKKQYVRHIVSTYGCQRPTLLMMPWNSSKQSRGENDCYDSSHPGLFLILDSSGSRIMPSFLSQH